MNAREYRELRERIGSQAQAAELLEVHEATLDRRENGRQRIRREAEYAIRWAALVAPPAPKVKRIKPKHASNKTTRAAKEERKAREFERCYHSRERVRFVAARGCIVCGKVPSENAHTIGGGMARKADYRTIVPLCRKHHREQHSIGIRTFSERHNLDLEAAAKATEQAWQEDYL